MGNYQRINTKKPKDIENKRAYLVGGGIASLAAAVYLIRDGHMKGEQITILEESNIVGGSMDGAGNAEDGYIIRGGREMEEHYECTWDLFASIPSIEDPNRTILDEVVEVNNWDPSVAACRVIEKRGKKLDSTTLGLNKSHIKQLAKLSIATEDELRDITVEQFFDPTFLETDMWLYWRSMFAFEPWHSVVEMKRYMQRFMHLMPGMSKLENILYSRYNQYDSMILPIKNWLKDKNVVFEYNTQVVDLDVDITENKKTVTAIHILRDGKEDIIKTTKSDLVFVTNGSMTENSTLGSMHKAPVLNTTEGGCWKLWKNIAKKDKSFGRPEVFCSDIDKTKWESFTITCTDSKMADILKDFTGRDPYSGRAITGGIITIKDSSWGMSVTCSRQPHFINQPKNVLVLWAYGLFVDNEGDYIKKKMSECTGEELMKELLYHLGVDENQMGDILKTVKVIPCMMPYITSQFMPRVKGDRPEVVPKGCVNLAFLGQFAEVKDDCVFTVEYSVRSAIMAVYKLLNLEKKVPEIYPSQFDIRVIANAVKTMHDSEGIPGEFIIKKLLKDTHYEGIL